MIESVKILVMNEEREVSKGTTLLELSMNYQDSFKYPILLATINGFYHELTDKITEPCDIEFFDLTGRVGNRVYLNGLIYMTILAIKETFGRDKDMRVLHSLDKGIYISTDFPITEEDIEKLETKMGEIVERDLPITKVNVARMDAIDYFSRIKDYSKLGVMKYNTNTYVTLYRLDKLYNYFFSLMPISTKYLSQFALTYLNETGFVLRFPTVYMENGIKEYVHHPKLFNIFKEYRDWAKLINIENASDLNKYVSNGKIGNLIRIDETLQSSRLLDVAKNIYDRKNVKIVLVAGPSSSGKTTTSNKLCMYLKSFGLNPCTLSMDDYFKERKDTPLGTDGKLDYECLEALDLELFDDQVAKLLNNEKVTIPTYNFILGMKEYKRDLQLNDEDILIIEGIHALSNKILTTIPRDKKYKIYLSALTELNIDNHNRISTSDSRLLRRIVRDNRTRGYKVEDTLKLWPKVRKGEEKYIFPYQDDADYTFNSAYIYELGVLKTYVEPLLYSVEPTSIYYEEAKRLIDFLRIFLPIPSEDIPTDSVLREFIGGSCFHD